MIYTINLTAVLITAIICATLCAITRGAQKEKSKAEAEARKAQTRQQGSRGVLEVPEFMVRRSEEIRRQQAAGREGAENE